MKQNIIHIASEVIQNSSFSGTLRTKQKFQTPNHRKKGETAQNIWMSSKWDTKAY